MAGVSEAPPTTDAAARPADPVARTDRSLAGVAVLCGALVAGLGFGLIGHRQDEGEVQEPEHSPVVVSRYDVPDGDPRPARTPPPPPEDNQSPEAPVDPALLPPDTPEPDATTDGMGAAGEDDWSDASDVVAPPAPEVVDPGVTVTPPEGLVPDAEGSDAAGAAATTPEPTTPDAQPSTPGPPVPDVPERPPTPPMPGPPAVVPPVTSDAPAAPPIVGDHPGRRLALDLVVELPASAAAGDTVDAVLKVRNAGEARLDGVEVGLSSRDDVVIQGSQGGLWRDRIERLEADAVETRTVRVRLGRAGSASLLASCREPRGWAAAGATNRIEVLARGATVREERKVPRAGPRLALALVSHGPRDVRAEEAFRLELAVENRGGVNFRGLTLVLEPAEGARLRGGRERIEERIELLEAGSRHVVDVVVHPDQPGLRILRASVRDDRGWAAAGVVQFVTVEPVPPPADLPAPGR